MKMMTLKVTIAMIDHGRATDDATLEKVSDALNDMDLAETVKNSIEFLLSDNPAFLNLPTLQVTVED